MLKIVVNQEQQLGRILLRLDVDGDAVMNTRPDQMNLVMRRGLIVLSFGANRLALQDSILLQRHNPSIRWNSVRIVCCVSVNSKLIFLRFEFPYTSFGEPRFMNL